MVGKLKILETVNKSEEIVVFYPILPKIVCAFISLIFQSMFCFYELHFLLTGVFLLQLWPSR